MRRNLRSKWIYCLKWDNHLCMPTVFNWKNYVHALCLTEIETLKYWKECWFRIIQWEHIPVRSISSLEHDTCNLSSHTGLQVGVEQVCVTAAAGVLSSPVFLKICEQYIWFWFFVFCFLFWSNWLPVTAVTATQPVSCTRPIFWLLAKLKAQLRCRYIPLLWIETINCITHNHYINYNEWPIVIYENATRPAMRPATRPPRQPAACTALHAYQ